MTATNQLLQFAGGSGANVLTPAEYVALTSIVANGFPSGILLSTNLNVVLRQSAFVASMIGQFIVNQAGDSALDDGNQAELLANFINALQQSTAGRGGSFGFTMTNDATSPLTVIDFGMGTSNPVGQKQILSDALAFPKSLSSFVAGSGNGGLGMGIALSPGIDRKSTRLNSSHR